MGKERFNDVVMGLDYLVFSAHKTATQSMVSTLRRNGYDVASCHILNNHPVSMAQGSFEDYARAYLERHKRKLRVITCFRKPIERHISSFFEWYGSKPLTDNKGEKYTETVIYKQKIPELQKKFIYEVSSNTLVGRVESIIKICNELRIELADLKFDSDKGYGYYETELIKLYLFRFDILVKDISGYLEIAIGEKLKQFDANKSVDKWYRRIYAEFKASVRIPEETVIDVYFSRKGLIDIFYNEGYEVLLNAALSKYCR